MWEHMYGSGKILEFMLAVSSFLTAAPTAAENVKSDFMATEILHTACNTVCSNAMRPSNHIAHIMQCNNVRASDSILWIFGRQCIGSHLWLVTDRQHKQAVGVDLLPSFFGLIGRIHRYIDRYQKCNKHPHRLSPIATLSQCSPYIRQRNAHAQSQMLIASKRHAVSTTNIIAIDDCGVLEKLRCQRAPHAGGCWMANKCMHI